MTPPLSRLQLHHKSCLSARTAVVHQDHNLRSPLEVMRVPSLDATQRFLQLFHWNYRTSSTHMNLHHT
ncbi:hypothetical protein F2Q70_00040656 [Brassica cretica]|uniref:Uncharacterized protein n=1 Tax=Brassica cretica TaxID=69181 RepID=A0A8S9K7F3_BRACR|nr:hypothetical protein F2Q70_00040656 [Brassica cretica]